MVHGYREETIGVSGGVVQTPSRRLLYELSARFQSHVTGENGGKFSVQFFLEDGLPSARMFTSSGVIGMDKIGELLDRMPGLGYLEEELEKEHRKQCRRERLKNAMAWIAWPFVALKNLIKDTTEW